MCNHTRNFQSKVLKINGLNSKVGSQLISLTFNIEEQSQAVISSLGVADDAGELSATL